VRVKAPIILASASPRRQQILRDLGLRFEIRPSDVDETIEPGTPPEIAVAGLARRKAEAVAGRLSAGLVIGADTIIAHDGRILGKPTDGPHAERMLRDLRAATHQVLTAVTVLDSGTHRCETDISATSVTMRPYSDTEIAAYVATGEPLDKAGSYAIQGAGGALVHSYDGPYDNVVGLPVDTLKRLLAHFGIALPARSR
jgi:septum formation protein